MRPLSALSTYPRIHERTCSVGGFRRTRYRGVERTGPAGYFVATAYNLVRMPNLLSCQEARAVQSV